MAPIDTIIQETIQVLSNSAWTGVGVIVSSAISLIALKNSRESHPHQISRPRIEKKITLHRWNSLNQYSVA